jgi:hypothetical protein
MPYHMYHMMRHPQRALPVRHAVRVEWESYREGVCISAALPVKHAMYLRCVSGGEGHTQKRPSDSLLVQLSHARLPSGHVVELGLGGGRVPFSL